MKAFYRSFAEVIAGGGPWTTLSVIGRSRASLPHRMDHQWLPDLVERMFVHFGDRITAPPQRAVAAFLHSDAGLHHVLSRQKRVPVIAKEVAGLPVMAPASLTFEEWQLPALTTVGELSHWLGVTPASLENLADPLGFETRRCLQSALHYRYSWIHKRGGRSRLLESPKQRLKELQRRFLTGVLDRAAPHAAAHAFRKGRSVKTFLQPHVGRDVVLHYDLREFFPSIRASRVFGVIRMLGYPESVARLMTGLCTNRTPPHIRREVREYAGPTEAAQSELLYRSAHLPQGAPTSPAISNLVAYRLDARLEGLAAKMNASYTRYADDLVFSGDANFRRALDRFGVYVLAIILDEGFHIQQRKTRVLPSGSRQQVAGVVLNDRPNLPRFKYDALRATLFNCVRHGPDSQNRFGHHDFRSHLLGLVSWASMLNPPRGRKLQALFDQIVWQR